MSSNFDLISDVCRKGSSSYRRFSKLAEAGITPEDLAKEFSNQRVPHGYVAPSILTATVGESYWRSAISPTMVVKAYENGVIADAGGMGRESGAVFADRSKDILTALDGDECLSEICNPAYVKKLFHIDLAQRRLNVAAVRLESSEGNNVRAAFTPDDISSLMFETVETENYVALLLVLKTTDVNPELRRDISTWIINMAFKGALQKYDESVGQRGGGHPHYTHVCVKLLEHTIDDPRLRAGIEPADIERLKACFAERISNPSGLDASSRRIDAEFATKGREMVELFTLADPQPEEISRLAAPFIATLDDKGADRLKRRHPRACLAGLRRYPASPLKSSCALSPS